MSKYVINKLFETEVQKYMQAVIKKLKSDNENIPDEWFASLDLMGDNYNTFIKCQKLIKENGLLVTNRFGDLVPNPLIKIQNDASIQLQKLSIEFFLTKKSASKLIESSSENEDSALMSFINKKKEVR